MEDRVKRLLSLYAIRRIRYDIWTWKPSTIEICKNRIYFEQNNCFNVIKILRVAVALSKSLVDYFTLRQKFFTSQIEPIIFARKCSIAIHWWTSLVCNSPAFSDNNCTFNDPDQQFCFDLRKLGGKKEVSSVSWNCHNC